MDLLVAGQLERYDLPAVFEQLTKPLYGSALPGKRAVQAGYARLVSVPGQNPYDDVSVHKVPVIRPDVDLLLSEVIALGGREEVERRYGLFYFHPPSFPHQLSSLRALAPADGLRAELTILRNQLLATARAAGWEVERLLTEARSGR